MERQVPANPSLESGGSGSGTLEARPGSQECQSPAPQPAKSPEPAMSLRWDALLLTALAHELREHLQGARLRAISPEGLASIGHANGPFHEPTHRPTRASPPTAPESLALRVVAVQERLNAFFGTAE